MPGQTGKERLDPIYTINEKSDSLPSAHEVYMNALTEYSAAQQLVGSWDYWKKMLRSSVRIRRLIDEWRGEKLLIDQTRARELMWKAAETGNASAARFLLESKKEEAAQKKAQTEDSLKLASEQEMLKQRLDRLTALKAV